MMANLFGDFVKGSDYSDLPEIVQEGVLLHRRIDDFIDHHEAVKTLRLQLYKELPKVAGIAIDLYMDHCLARNWENYHNQHLSDYLNSFFEYALTPTHQHFNQPDFKYPIHFIDLLTLIHKQEWIQNYKYLKGLNFACSGLSKRISFPNNLHEGTAVYENNKEAIDSTFSIFMSDAKNKFNIQ